ncbi:hypothetical protein [Spirillospora sp. NPDC029432]|uniref:hypothetical protein n=1 Tax=Spirillospora sp. NPDC029432 TaxID=3154599 RepID=UPI003456B16E
MTTHGTGPIVPGDLFARHQTITGLRALADFLEANPNVPVNEYGETFTVYTRHLADDDPAAVALVDRTAALLGVDVGDRRDHGDHYTAARSFGRIRYQVVHIPARVMDDFHARTSYENNVITDTPAGGDSTGRAA